MTREHQRPVLQPSSDFEWIIGAGDPSATQQLAQETSWALLDRVRRVADPEVVDRVVRLAEGSGIDDIAELWSQQGPHSLAGVLWRLYLLRQAVTADPPSAADLFSRGEAAAPTIDPVVAGVVDPVTPQSIETLCDTILRGAFVGDLGAAIDRAASYCRIMALGAADLADTRDAHDDDQAAQLTRRALRYSSLAEELYSGGKNWRAGTLM